MKLKKCNPKTPEDIKQYFKIDKTQIKWAFDTIMKGDGSVIYLKQKVGYVDELTGYTIVINGIGDKKVNIDTYYYTYETLFKKFQQGAKHNSLTLNAFFNIFFEGYNYYKEGDIKLRVKEIIKNRKHAGYLLVNEIPENIPLALVKTFCRNMDLPLILSFN